MKKFISITLMSLITIFLSAQTKVILKPGNLDGKDAWIWSYDPFKNTNFGESNASNNSLNNVIRAEVWVWGTKADTIRGVLDFDLSSIPVNTIIADAKLSLFYFANNGFTQQTGQNDLLIQRVTQSWTETGVSWNNQPNTSAVNQLVLAKSGSKTQDYIDIDVTLLVQDMIDSSSNSHGFMLKMDNEVQFKGLTFASSEHSDASLHPKLEITYDSTTGLFDSDRTKQLFTSYPNPSSEYIMVEFPDYFPKEISILDFTGKRIKSIKINSKKTMVDLKEFLPGVYFLKFNLKGVSLSEKFLKIRE